MISSYVYMIRAGDHCKVGKADNPTSRINGFRTGCPFPIEMIGTIEVDDPECAFAVESSLHECGRAAGLHRDREWFDYSPRFAAKFLALGSSRLSKDAMHAEAAYLILSRIANGARTMKDSPFSAVIDVSATTVESPPAPRVLIPVAGSDHGAAFRRAGIVASPFDPDWGHAVIGTYEWYGDHFFIESCMSEPPLVMPITRLHAIHDLLEIPRLDVDQLLAWDGPNWGHL